MQISASARQWLIPGLLLITAIAFIMAPPEPATELVQQSKRAAFALQDDLVKPPDQIFKTQERQTLADNPVDIFFQEDLEEKAANEVRQQQARQAQVAPPLPYVYMGKQDKNGEQTVFLTRADMPYVAKAGDVLDGQYRVDMVLADMIQFTYLPMGQKQILNIGTNP